jgi:DNA repair protein RecO (recombination protein O)
MRQKESAICLRTSDYSETSQVVHFITRGWGLVRLLAKGAKRPKSSSGGAIDILSEGELVFIASSRESLGTLVEFSESVSRGELRGEAGRLNAALFMAELTGLLVPEGDPHVAVFDLLHNALERLGQAGAPVPAVLAFFQWRLLRHVGLLGELDACVSCGAAIDPLAGRPVYFTSAQGGLLCPVCEGRAGEKYRLTGAAMAGIAAMKAVQSGQKVALNDAQADALNQVLAYHAAHQLGKPLKMAKHAIGPEGRNLENGTRSP